MILLWLGVTGQEDQPIVCRGQFDIDHLDSGKFFEHGPSRQSGRQRLEALFERDLQTVGKKRHENVGFDAGFQLVVDGSNRKIVLQFLERLLDIP